jgi:HAD superfamily hydrolase (TIGR01549 family)
MGNDTLPFDRQVIQAVVFDYGNTLVEFGRSQTETCDAALADAVTRLYGPMDRDRLRAIRDRNRMAPYAGDPPEYRENDLRAITAGLVRELYGVEPSLKEIEILLRVRFEVFVRVTQASDGVAALLGLLRRRYRLGLLSNYPDGDAIRASLRQTGLDVYFDSVVVSADVGYAKPHPLPFETIARNLGLPPEPILLVGDNWLADVQGGRRAGMYVAQSIQWMPPEQFARRPGDFEPHLILRDLAELESYLCSG